jgi:nitroreductase
MDLLRIIKERRSIRAFKVEKAISDADLEQLLEAAIWAPSAGNVQPWKFYVISDAGLKKALVRAAYGQSFIAEAPVVFVVCVELNEASMSYGTRGASLYCIQDTAAAIQNILLMACSMGLGSCWVGAFDEGEAAEALGCPPGQRPVAIIPIGYPAEQPSAPRRKAIKHVVMRR